MALSPKAESRKAGKASKGNASTNKEGGVELCQGYLDEYGIWNNGFYCPRWGGPDERYCCGQATKRFCCEEPVPIEPPNHDKHAPPTTLPSSPSDHPGDVASSPCSSAAGVLCTLSNPLSIPLIAGVSAVVVILIVTLISCFVCRCCPGYKRMKRTRQGASSNQPQTREVQCSHCHATTTQIVNGEGGAGDEPTLACGCPVGGPHHHHRPDSSIPASDLIATLFENPNATWQSDLLNELENGELRDFPLDDPPPYRECNNMHDKLRSPDSDSTKSTEGDITEATPLNNTFRLSNPNLLCMQTFRPLHSPLTSPGFYLTPSSPRGSTSGGPGGSEQEYSKRDSGCIDDDQQPDETPSEHDDQSIMVPKFHFQSLSLCRSINSGGGGGGGGGKGQHRVNDKPESLAPEAFGLSGLSSPPHS